MVLRDRDTIWNSILQEKAIILNTVEIGKGSKENFMKLFRKYFMGDSENAKACKIINPEALEFRTNKTQE